MSRRKDDPRVPESLRTGLPEAKRSANLYSRRDVPTAKPRRVTGGIRAGAEPTDIQRGQTLQVRLTLDDPSPARLLPNGAFYDETRGAFVFVVSPDGSSAVKRPVRLGRRNAESIEVLQGLDAGERVITSPYTGFADKARLDLTQGE